ncbi:GNAT family acetyltransferase (macronuclear) [Tetrahymena thermophila SB210]|uniref:GNAT family acetyltransferase n=1 Tax=Tetrahymena thermophila (strain SB210) TaxID=312017 RepID=Q22D77_TETTS|nr:GNAT family acetyltransferase [Tetrahymena thermophila SB210]EAR83248.1 GNAT family acetyltransferase [Tetrahymena thermophila SB210]|eukprot:XP_001030911.1 GNAT family acetyltransferase [Tetrahymena thermophila SB210]
MQKINSIKYQVLEAKYIKATIDCLNQVRNQAGTFNHELGYKEQIKSEENTIFMQYPDVCCSTIIALDTQKEDYVCGILAGLDFCHYTQILRKQASDSFMNEKNQMALKLVEPLIALNYQKGESLVAMNLGVRSEYENLKIGSNLLRLLIERASELRYSIITGITYNPIATHVFQKNNFQICSCFDMSKSNLDEEIKKRIKHKDLYLLGILIQNNISNIKIPQILQKPNI